MFLEALIAAVKYTCMTNMLKIILLREITKNKTPRIMLKINLLQEMTKNKNIKTIMFKIILLIEMTKDKNI